MFDLREFNLAEVQLREAYQRLNDNPEASPASRRRAAQAMAELLNETDRPDEAATWNENLADRRSTDNALEEVMEPSPR